jgi:hypothetical protein
MTPTFRDRYKGTITNTPGIGGALVLDGALSGYQRFDATDDGLFFDIVINDVGNTWEIRKECQYTHASSTLSAGTFSDSSSGSAIALTSSAIWAVTLLSERVFPSTITTETNNDILSYNSTTGRWENKNSIIMGGASTFNSTLSATSTITLGGATTSATSLGTSATTGTTTIGGTAQTGTITIGRSTATQSLNLGNGATASGSTKTINIGANGVSGSTTNIFLGSSVSGATNNVTFRGNLNLPSIGTSGLIGLGAGGAVSNVSIGSGLDLTAGVLTANSVTTAINASVLRQYVKNDTGAVITKGQVVYISGASGTNVLISLAKADTDATSATTIGFAAQDFTVNGFGYIITEGILTGIDTSAATVEGDPIWLSPTTDGGVLYGMANKPHAPDHMVYLGVVSRKNVNNGEIFIKCQNGYELDELHNVLISAPVDTQVLTYETSSGLWKNKPSYSYTLPVATASVLGGVKQGTNIAIDGSGVISSTYSYSLPSANTTTLGGVIVPAVATSGINNTSGTIGLATASTTQLGGVKVDGTTITISGGIISSTGGYSLPTASTTVLGGVKVDGTTITINGSGVISSSGSGSPVDVLSPFMLMGA